MKKILTVILTMMFVAPLYAAAPAVEIQPKFDETGAEIMGNVQEPAVNEHRILIDDFEDGDTFNRLDGQCGAWNLDTDESESYCRPALVQMPAPEMSEYVLRLAYDVDSPRKAENGYWMQLNEVDVSNYTHLEFFIKGDEKEGFTTKFIIEFKKFKDDGRTEKIAAACEVTNVTSTWQRVSIPLAKFSAIDEYQHADATSDWSRWKRVDELVIIFKDRLADVKKGVLYFDTVQLVKNEDRLPHAFDQRLSVIRKSYQEHDHPSWARWIAGRLVGQPTQVVVKKEFPQDDREFLMTVARDTWKFFNDIVDKKTHLPLDTICLTRDNVFGEGGYFGDYTNVTNIGLYMTCMIAGMDLGFITREDAIARIQNTLTTVERIETYRDHMFNYYDTTTMERTSNFISQIDNGWLALGVYVVKNAFPDELGERCAALLKRWDFSFFYDPVAQQFYHGYYTNTEAYANYHYGTFYTEPRIVSYLSVARGDVPMEHWFKLDRTLPESYDWQSLTPMNRRQKEYKGVTYFGGYYEVNGMKYVPSWGGSLFEALMPTVLLKEKEIAPRSLGLNDETHVKLHIKYALEECKYPVWGMSPCSVPEGGYSEFGVKSLGMKGYKPGVVTPHVTFLALEFASQEAIANARKLIELYDIYGEYGFYDAVDPVKGTVAYKYLCLDQAMILLAIDNYLNNGAIRERFHKDETIKKAEYLLKDEGLFE